MLALTGCASTGVSAQPVTEATGTHQSQAEIVIRTEAPPITIFTEAPPITKVTESPAEPPTVESADSSSQAPAVCPSSKPAGSDALTLLKEIPVKGRAPKTGYDRGLFGSGWGDPDRNGCDARNDILARDLTVHSYKPGTSDCIVLTGILTDPYTNSVINFQRGQGTSNAVQIDHVVALSDAWQKGAQQLSATTRQEFANDPLNLLAVDGPTNSSKGDGDAATWLPPNRAYWCDYVTRQVQVKHKYDLWMTAAEHKTSSEILTTRCN